jgi:hypothetical protein
MSGPPEIVRVKDLLPASHEGANLDRAVRSRGESQV